MFGSSPTGGLASIASKKTITRVLGIGELTRDTVDTTTQLEGAHGVGLDVIAGWRAILKPSSASASHVQSRGIAPALKSFGQKMLTSAESIIVNTPVLR